MAGNRWGKSTAVVICIAAALAIYFARISARDLALQRQEGPAIVARVRQQYGPSQKLMAMHPLGDFQWVATKDPVDCTFQRPQIPNCWEVYFGVRVAGPDPLGRAPGKVEANFIVNGDTLRIMPIGRGVGAFFNRREPMPGKQPASMPGQDQKGGTP